MSQTGIAFLLASICMELAYSGIHFENGKLKLKPIFIIMKSSTRQVLIWSNTNERSMMNLPVHNPIRSQ